MKIKPQLILLIIAFIVSGIFGVGSCYIFYSEKDSANTKNEIIDKSFGWKFPNYKFQINAYNKDLVAASYIRVSNSIPTGLPVRLKIPTIGVNSLIEDAYITPYGRMDVPQGSVNVAWFALGPHPGDIGSAVIGGHFGIKNNIPFVFYNLDKLKIGDKIYIENDKGETKIFLVKLISLFGRDADATTVFSSTDGLAHLNVITCEGIWNKIDGSYPLRRVIFTDLIPNNNLAK